ncbi:MAG: hypothetical protein J4F99_04275 [Acidimicrobiia bacterium]|nr:hypothetical protein [Acidimicrobiia bacterium]
MTEHADRRLYATWRHPEGLIHPVGILTRRGSDRPDGEVSFRFVYLKSAEQLKGFRHLPGLPDLHRVYDSPHLFPVFRNRQMPRRRPDYEDYVRELDLEVTSDPFEVLARSEGWRATDRIEVFAYPDRTSEGDITTLFFARGIRHLDGAAEAVSRVEKGDVLNLVDDADNDINPLAMLMSNRTSETVGWVPNYLIDMIHELRDPFGVDVEIIAEHVNPATTPPHMRLLCRLQAPWPDGYEPLSAQEFQPIVS